MKRVLKHLFAIALITPVAGQTYVDDIQKQEVEAWRELFDYMSTTNDPDAWLKRFTQDSRLYTDYRKPFLRQPASVIKRLKRITSYLAFHTSLTGEKDPDAAIPVTPSGDKDARLLTITVNPDGSFLLDGKPDTLDQIPERTPEMSGHIYVSGGKDSMIKQMKTVLKAASEKGHHDVVFSGKAE